MVAGSPAGQRQPAAVPARRPRLWAWLRWGTVLLLLGLLLLDALFPPPLPQQRDTATLVTAADGTPLRAFADAQGVWRDRKSVV